MRGWVKSQCDDDLMYPKPWSRWDLLSGPMTLLPPDCPAPCELLFISLFP